MRILKAAGAAGLSMAAMAAAQAATFIPVVPVPGSMTTVVMSINDNNVIAGGYYTDDGREHSFFGPLDGSNYTTFDFKAGQYPNNEARGINNDGIIVGNFNLLADAPDYHQYERLADGTFKIVKKNGAWLGGLIGQIGNKGMFAGEYWAPGYQAYLGHSGKYKSDVFVDVEADYSRGRGVNVHGDVVGFAGIGPVTNGFWIHNGVTNVIAYPDPSAVSTDVNAINDKGVLAGYWSDSGFFTSYGFTFDTRKAEYRPVVFSGSPHRTRVYGINNAGLAAVQSYDDDFVLTSYIYCPHHRQQCPAGGIEVPDREPIHVAPGSLLRYGDKKERPPSAVKPFLNR